MTTPRPPSPPSRSPDGARLPAGVVCVLQAAIQAAQDSDDHWARMRSWIQRHGADALTEAGAEVPARPPETEAIEAAEQGDFDRQVLEAAQHTCKCGAVDVASGYVWPGNGRGGYAHHPEGCPWDGSPRSPETAGRNKRAGCGHMTYVPEGAPIPLRCGGASCTGALPPAPAPTPTPRPRRYAVDPQEPPFDGPAPAAPEEEPRGLAEALEIMEFHEGSATVERRGAHPTVRINAEDFAKVLAALRRERSKK